MSTKLYKRIILKPFSSASIFCSAASRKGFEKLSSSIAVFLLSQLFIIPIYLTSVSFKNTLPLKTIVIDAGHGGIDAGSKGKISSEKYVTLQVALRLGKAIRERYPDTRVIYTRSTDVFIPLYKRIEIANQSKADLFISIHCNSMPANSPTRSSTNGTETFVSGFGRTREQDVAVRENASILLEKNYQKNYDGYDPRDPESIIIFSLIKNTNRTQSIRFAKLLQTEYVKSGRQSRGFKEQSLAVLAKAGMPAVLTEIGFISNPAEERYLNSDEGQDELVASQIKAIEAYGRAVD